MSTECAHMCCLCSSHTHAHLLWSQNALEYVPSTTATHATHRVNTHAVFKAPAKRNRCRKKARMR
eukprot:14212619-Alexandrium_andersonii.AAC.1